MKIAFIPPLNLLNQYASISDYQMALTHLVERQPGYAAFYKERARRGDYVILDNSVIELGKSLHVDRLAHAADAIGAKEIILPDVLDDSPGTFVRSRESAEFIRAKYGDKYKLMVVPQGKDLREFLRCYEVMAACDWVDVIGIPKRTGRFFESPLGRRDLISHMVMNKYIDQSKPHHLLGIYSNPLEIYYLNIYDWIRGIDSQIPFLAAHHNIKFDPVKGMTEDRAGRSIELEYNYYQIDTNLLDHNIMCMLRWAHNSPLHGTQLCDMEVADAH